MILSTGKSRGFVISGVDFEQAQFLPGATFRRKEGVVRMPENVASWKVLREVDFEAITDDALGKIKSLEQKYREHRRSVRNAERRFKKTGETDIPVPLKTLPYSHQVRAFGFATSLDQSALLMDQGTGKTLVAIAVAGHRYLNNQVKKVLVICPRSVKPVWPKELRKHADFPYTASIDSPPDDRGLQFYITNYDKVSNLKRVLRKWKPDLIILDESHKIKNRKTDRFKGCNFLKAVYRMILSGTIIGKCISEAWSQYKFLNPDIFGTNFSDFKDRYLKMGGYMGYKVVGYKNEQEFSDKLHSIAFRCTKDECLDLPPLSYQKLYVESDSTTRKIYREMDLEKFTVVNDEEVTADLDITKQIKLRQIVGGIVKSDDAKLSKVSEKKISALGDYLEDRQGKKTVIFFSFTHEIKMAQKLCDRLKLPHITLQGSTSDEDRAKFETRFEEEHEVALIQQQTGGEGITLACADVAIFYSPTFSYIGYAQARDRIYRIGQTRPVTVVWVIMQETVDETVVAILESNQILTNRVLETNRNYTLSKEPTMAKKETTNTFTAADLATEFNVSSAVLRKALRATGAKKPATGWSWKSKTDKSLGPIRKALKAHFDKAPTPKAPAKKTAAKGKATAKKTPAKKTPAKKAPRRRVKKS